MPQSKTGHVLFLLSFASVLALIFIIYWNGLHGPFLLDDYANIKALGEVGGVYDLATFKLFVFGNDSGPTGRPITMLSFLLNDIGWPSEPFTFKYTNLLLHLLNGILLTWIILQLSGSLPGTSKHWIALLASAIWLLHPLNVSTVLYPVQRMTILATTFVLAGILVHLAGRKLTETSVPKGYFLQVSGLVIFTALAALSKENGALLPVFILIIELTILPVRTSSAHKVWFSLFLVVPSAILFFYLIKDVSPTALFAESTHRPFTMWERLITQPRVLLDYLYYWFIPHIDSPGLLTQDFPLSKSLTNPVTTLPALLAIILLPVLAIVYRHRFPMISLAILFYCGGQLIESSVIQLELYFEHRNYLPGIFLSLPIAVAISSKTNNKGTAIALALLMISILSLLTWQRATIWSDEQALADQWARIHPYSQRAQRNAALVAEKNGNLTKAISVLQLAKDKMPRNVTVHLHWLSLYCRYNTVHEDLQGETLELLENGFYNFRNPQMLSSTLVFIATPACKGVDSEFALRAIRALTHNRIAKKEAGARHQLSHIKGLIYLSRQEYDNALLSFQDALHILPRIESGLLQVALLATHHQYNKALQHIDNIKHTIREIPKSMPGTVDYAREIKILEENILRVMVD